MTPDHEGLLPEEIPDLVYLFDPRKGCWQDDGITPCTNNTRIYRWDDQGPYASHHRQATEDKRPYWQENLIGGEPVAIFDGLNDWLGGSTHVSGSTQHTTFHVIFPTNGNGPVKYIEDWLQWSHAWDNYNAHKYFYYNGSSHIPMGNHYHIAQILRWRLAPPNMTLHVNGLLNETKSQSGKATPAGHWFGSGAYGVFNFFGGYLGYAVHYARALTAAECAHVENYLSARFGIPLAP